MNNSPWQLSLFPFRGYALALPGRELAVDHRTGLPVIRATRRSIKRVRLPAWLAPYARPVQVEVHGDEPPCYVVLP